MMKEIQISLRLPNKFIIGLDALVEKEIYGSRAEAIREAVRDMLREKHPATWDSLWTFKKGMRRT